MDYQSRSNSAIHYVFVSELFSVVFPLTFPGCTSINNFDMNNASNKVRLDSTNLLLYKNQLLLFGIPLQFTALINICPFDILEGKNNQDSWKRTAISIIKRRDRHISVRIHLLNITKGHSKARIIGLTCTPDRFLAGNVQSDPISSIISSPIS